MGLRSLIPLKAYAFLDLSAKGAESGKYKKHEGDILRLSQLLPEGEVYEIPARAYGHVMEFLEKLEDRKVSDLKAIGIQADMATIRETLKNAYRPIKV